MPVLPGMVFSDSQHVILRFHPKKVSQAIATKTFLHLLTAIIVVCILYTIF